jgi:two-component system cell cycle sensor histidine kinase/response regulator CckA
VLDAVDAPAALLRAEKHRKPIHLLLTDVVLPGIGGRELAGRLKALRPEMKVLFTSGYTDDAMMRRGVAERGIAFMQKPFTPETLTRRVRQVLDRS